MKLKKIFNLLYKDTVSTDKFSRFRSFLNIIATRYTIENENIITKEYILFNKTFFKRTDIDSDRIWEFNNKIIKKESLRKILEKKILHKIDSKYDDIYLFNSHIGETYIFFKYIFDECLKKHKSKSPLIIGSKNYHKSIANMFYPDIPCIIKKINLPVCKAVFNLDDVYYTNIAPRFCFKKIDDLINNNSSGSYYYFEELAKLYDCSINDTVFKKVSFSLEKEKSVIKKIKKINLNTDNFVMIFPEAQTCALIDNLFWVNLINKYKNLGFDIFLNTARGKINADYKYTFLDCEELLILSKKAKKIIVLRSGIADLLSENNVAMDVLYTEFRDRIFLNKMDVEHVLASFNLKSLPHANKKLINEIKAKDYVL